MNDWARAKVVYYGWIKVEDGELCYEAGRAAACVSVCPLYALLTRAGEVVGNGGVEEVGGVCISVRGCKATLPSPYLVCEVDAQPYKLRPFLLSPAS